MINEKIWKKKILHLLYGKDASLIAHIGADIIALILLIIIKVFHYLSWNINVPLNIFIGILLFQIVGGFMLEIYKDKIRDELLEQGENELIVTHQTENLQEYENIRTQFTLHNIKNAVINANNYMDILRKGKMDLSIATENIQVCLDRIDEILEVFKDSDYAQKRTEFRLEELFTTFQMLYHSTMIRRDIQFEVIY
jgi:hypothetical protein